MRDRFVRDYSLLGALLVPSTKSAITERVLLLHWQGQCIPLPAEEAYRIVVLVHDRRGFAASRYNAMSAASSVTSMKNHSSPGAHPAIRPNARSSAVTIV